VRAFLKSELEKEYGSVVRGHRPLNFRDMQPNMFSNESFCGFPYNKCYRDMNHFVTAQLSLAEIGKDIIRPIWDAASRGQYFAQPWNLHIKCEPTKLVKIEEHRLRPINAPNAATRVLQQMAMWDFCKRVLHAPQPHPVAAGRTKFYGGMHSLAVGLRSDEAKWFMEKDAEFWDTTFPREIREVVAEFFDETQGYCSAADRVACKAFVEEGFASLVRAPDGRIFLRPDGLGPGDYATTVFNSLGNFCLNLWLLWDFYGPERVLTWRNWFRIFVAGDDELSSGTNDDPPQPEWISGWYKKIGMSYPLDRIKLQPSLVGLKFYGSFAVKTAGGFYQPALDTKRAFGALAYSAPQDEAQFVDTIEALRNETVFGSDDDHRFLEAVMAQMPHVQWESWRFKLRLYCLNESAQAPQDHAGWVTPDPANLCL
jgi:hypothetical protein